MKNIIVKSAKQTSDKRFCVILGHIGMLIFMVFGAYYYQERTLLMDSSYYTFNLLQDETFFIAHKRYINYFNQWLPLILIKLGCGLKTILIGYSVSFMLFYYAVFAIIVHLFDNYKAGLGLLLALILSCKFKHYVAVTETTNTLTLAFLFIGWITREKYLKFDNPIKELTIAFVFVLMLLIGHPIIFLPLLSFMAFYLVFYGKLKNPYAWLTFGFVFIAFLVRQKIIGSSGYEYNKMQALYDAPEVIPKFFQQYSFHHLRDYTLKNFKPGLYLYLISLLVLLFNKKILSALVSISTLCLYVAVVVVIYHKGESIAMLESYYTFFGMFWSLVIISAFPLVRSVPWMKYVLISVVVALSFRTILKKGSFFTKRLNYLYSLTEEAAGQDSSKTLYPRRLVDWHQVIVPWAVPFNTLLYSTLKDPKDSRTVSLYKTEDIPNLNVTDTTLFMGATFNKKQWDTKYIPKKYFELKPAPYHRVE